jgi:hypothetical protein
MSAACELEEARGLFATGCQESWRVDSATNTSIWPD